MTCSKLWTIIFKLLLSKIFRISFANFYLTKRKQPMPPAPDNFFGREEELATLRQLWDQATTKDANGAYGGPRMAMILAETGYGKTRLIQALYQQLTKDPLWDPAEVNYWPDAFQELSNQLRVNPDMTKHSPNGPPRFLWAGMRWFSPEERNVEERTCSLPEIRNVLRTHVEISRRHSDVWTKLKAKAGKAIKTDGISEATEQIVDFLGIPFGGLLLKGVKAIGNLATAKSSRSFREESEKKAMDITEELLGDFREIFGAIGSGGIVLPTILFLDDAQRIDPITFKFIGQLWREAYSKKWPLFVVITHWERNWRELLRKPENEHESSLVYFTNKKGVHFIDLGPSSNNDLEGYLKQKLTGLTEEQRKLLLDKSGGNFLSLVENVGFLLQNLENFENENSKNKLSEAGKNEVITWPEGRQQRIGDMFNKLKTNEKKILGWGSQLGKRFIENVVVDFARTQGIEGDPKQLLAECIDPLVILGKASENIREFRHQAFQIEASKYFKTYHSRLETQLKSTLQKHLSQWVNNSFTSAGGLVEIDETDEDQNINAVIFLESSERRDLLEMAVREFKPENGQAKDLDTWIRAVYLLISIDSENNLWDLVREKGNLIKEVDWHGLLISVLNLSLRNILTDSLETSGAIRSAKRIRQNILHQQKLLCGLHKSPESLHDVSASLLNIGDIEVAERNLDTAKKLYYESLEISRKLAEQLNTPESLRDVSISLNRIGDVERAERHLDRARTLYYESLEISRKLAEQLKTQDALRDLSYLLERIGGIEQEERDWDKTKLLYAESLDIKRKLAEQLKTPDSLREVYFSLGLIANLEKAQGNLGNARALYFEGLQIAEKLTEQINTPESFREFSISFGRIGDIEKAEEKLDSARTHFAKSLKITRKLAEQLNTPESLRDFCHSLERSGGIERAKEQKMETKLLSEVLRIAKELEESPNTSESLSDVSDSLERIGDIEQAEGHLHYARELYSESLKIRRKLEEQLKTPKALRNVSVSLERIGAIEVKENLNNAKPYFTESLGIARKVAKILDTPEALQNVSVSLERIGLIERAEGNLECAKGFYSESFEISRNLTDQFNIPDFINGKIWTLQQLAHVQILLEENQAAFNLLKESESDVDELQSKCSGDVGILDTVATYWERRTEVEVKLKLPEAKNSKAKTEAIRNEIENKKAK